MTKNNQETGRFIPPDVTLTDILTGILKGKEDLDKAREERLKEKYGAAD